MNNIIINYARHKRNTTTVGSPCKAVERAAARIFAEEETNNPEGIASLSELINQKP